MPIALAARVQVGWTSEFAETHRVFDLETRAGVFASWALDLGAGELAFSAGGGGAFVREVRTRYQARLIAISGIERELDPIVFDLTVNPDVIDSGFGVPVPESGQADPISPPRGAAPSAWKHTLSRSERRRASVWVPFDFDRTHIMNAVFGLPLPRNWSLGLRVHAETGRPATTTFGFNSARSSAFVRFDVRVDKRAVWNDWLLDFYVDVSNAVLGTEEISPGQDLRYVIPTVGFRAVL